MNPGNLISTARHWFWPALVVYWVWNPTVVARFVDDTGWALHDLISQAIGRVF